MPALRTLLENAVVAKLAPLKLVALGGAAGGYLELVKAYQGSLEPDPDDQWFLEIINGRSPGVLVTTGPGDYQAFGLDRTEADQQVELVLLVYSSNLRSQVAKAQGDGYSSDKGIYQIIEDVRDALWSVELGVTGVGQLQPVREQDVVRTGDRAIWQLSYTVTMDASAVRPEDAADDYESRLIMINNPIDDDADPIVEGSEDLE